MKGFLVYMILVDFPDFALVLCGDEVKVGVDYDF